MRLKYLNERYFILVKNNFQNIKLQYFLQVLN